MSCHPGESFLRQIQIGNKYFLEKFGVKSTTAVNVDPFGHTRGLVQILKKCGYDSYLLHAAVSFCDQSRILYGRDMTEVRLLAIISLADIILGKGKQLIKSII